MADGQTREAVLHGEKDVAELVHQAGAVPAESVHHAGPEPVRQAGELEPACLSGGTACRRGLSFMARNGGAERP